MIDKCQVVCKTNTRLVKDILFDQYWWIFHYIQLIGLIENNAHSIENVLFSFMHHTLHFISCKCFIEMQRMCSSWLMVDHVQVCLQRKYCLGCYDTLEYNGNVIRLIQIREKAIIHVDIAPSSITLITSYPLSFTHKNTHRVSSVKFSSPIVCKFNFIFFFFNKIYRISKKNNPPVPAESTTDQ